MAIDPSTLHNSISDPNGVDFLNQYHSFVGGLVQTAVLRLTNVLGTNAIRATAEPFSVPSSGLVTGMKFTLVPFRNNTRSPTLNIDGRGARSVVGGDGTAIGQNALVAGTRYFLEFNGTNFVIIGSQSIGSSSVESRTIYDTTTSWANTIAANALVMVELWGAGGGGRIGATNTGSGGGAYATAIYRAGDLPSTVTISVASGSAPGTVGGSTTFGTLLTAFGGGATTGAGLGGGGGALGPGGVNSSGSPGGTLHSGGGGGTNAAAAGDAVYGGGGGGGTNPGRSKYGGNGGAGGQPGFRPGGGGGGDSEGGAGRCIITIIGG